MGHLPSHGDYISLKTIWDQDQGVLYPVDTTLDRNGHVPRNFRITSNGLFDPYHWIEFSRFFWLDLSICNSLRFTKNERGDFTDTVTIRQKNYIIIIDEPKRFLKGRKTQSPRCIVEPEHFIFSIEAIEFEGELSYIRNIPLYNNMFCFFLTGIS